MNKKMMFLMYGLDCLTLNLAFLITWFLAVRVGIFSEVSLYCKFLFMIAVHFGLCNIVLIIIQKIYTVDPNEQ